MKFNNDIEITNLKNVRRLPDGGFLLNIDLLTPTDPLETVEYCARSGDIAETGKWVYQQIIEGNFEGEITDWVPPPPPSVGEVSIMIRSVRNSKLKSEFDLIATNPFRWNDLTLEQQQAWTDYRRALLDLPQNPEFPWYAAVTSTGYEDLSVVPWPTKPF